MLEHVEHHVPVTALAFSHDNNEIFAGEGNILRVYDCLTKEVLASKPVFKRQALHGIIARTSTNVAWGGNLLCTFALDRTSDRGLQLRVGPVCKVVDWILDATFSPDGTLIALVTAHNSLTVARTGQLHDTAICLEPCAFGPKRILYAAHVTWLSPSQYLIASGTALGDVIVWSCNLLQTDGGFVADPQIHYIFPAHEGSVFGVQLSTSPPCGVLGSCKCLLATCSDDRMVSVWDLSELDTNSPITTRVQRDAQSGLNDAADPHGPPRIVTAMGHISRIWLVRFLHDRDAASQRIISFGEDASNITWNLEVVDEAGRPGASYRLAQVDTQTAHAGKNIWSVAVGADGTIATGGADGAIAIRNDTQAITHEIKHVCSPLDGSDNFRSYDFVDKLAIVSTTDQGRIVLVTFQYNEEASISEISGSLPSLKGYSIVTCARGIAFIAGKAASVYVYHHVHGQFTKLELNTSENGKSNGKITGLFCGPSSGDDKIALLVTRLGAARPLLYEVNVQDLGNPEIENHVSSITASCDLLLPSDFVVTSFLMHPRESKANILLLGSRGGSILMLDLQYDNVAQPAKILTIISDAHGKEAVTCLAVLSDETGSRLFLHSTGRDGTHVVHGIDIANDSTVKTVCVHNPHLPLGPNVDGLTLTASYQPRVWGFRSKHFVVHDIGQQRDVIIVDCGGAHRSWAFQPHDGGGTFVWTRATKLYWRTQTELPYHFLNGGAHGREIKAIAVSPTSPQLIATGAEDTDIKLHILDDRARVQCMQTLRKHNTGIQHLQWSEDGVYLFSSGGFEEFVVWRVSGGIPGVGIGVVCEAVHPRSGTSDLRVMGFEAMLAPARDEKSRRSAFEVWMAYSDSTVKSWFL